jgi:hypothetical protein
MSVRVGVTTMATDPPERFRELVALVEGSGFNIFLLSADKPAMVRELGRRMLPRLKAA